jgi:hypothetical protein
LERVIQDLELFVDWYQVTAIFRKVAVKKEATSAREHLSYIPALRYLNETEIAYLFSDRASAELKVAWSKKEEWWKRIEGSCFVDEVMGKGRLGKRGGLPPEGVGSNIDIPFALTNFAPSICLLFIASWVQCPLILCLFSIHHFTSVFAPNFAIVLLLPL